MFSYEQWFVHHVFDSDIFKMGILSCNYWIVRDLCISCAPILTPRATRWKLEGQSYAQNLYCRWRILKTNQDAYTHAVSFSFVPPERFWILTLSFWNINKSLTAKQKILLFPSLQSWCPSGPQFQPSRNVPHASEW